MKHKALLSLALAAVITASGTVGYTGKTLQIPMNVSAADDGNDDWLHAEGSRLFDKNGKEVWLTGANWFGMNCTENFPHGLWSADVDVLLSQVADRGINIIRFPISTELLLSWMNGAPYSCTGLNPKNTDGYSFNPDFCHADGSEMNSMEVFDVIIQKCKKYGIKALVDVHSPASHNSGHNYELWYYEESSKTADDMATVKEEEGKTGTKITWQDWIDSLTWLAKKYANDDTILAYDLKNEPHGKRGYSGSTCPSDIARWDNTELKNNWKYSAEQCANSILKVNPNALILVEGVEQYPKTDKGFTYDTADIWDAPADQSPWYGAWWGGNLRGVKDYPVKPASGTSQIVYSPHDYGPSVYAQTWFDKDFTEETLLDDYWRDTWAYINEQEIAPLLIGEWGGHMDGGKNQKWMTLLRDYMVKHHINHTFWCLNPNSGDTGGLLNATFSEWDSAKYALFEESLWQTKSGKYIGLDHQTPLGKNGMSLSQFYSSGEGSNLDAGGPGGQGHSVSDNPPVQQTTQPPVTTTAAPVTTTAAPVTTTTVSVTTTAAPVSTTTVQPDPGLSYYYQYQFNLQLMLVPFMPNANLTDAQKTAAQQAAFDFMSKVSRIEVSADDASGKTHLIDQEALSPDGNPVYWKSNTRVLTDNSNDLHMLVDMQNPQGGWYSSGTGSISIAIENLTKPIGETRQTVTNNPTNSDESGGNGYNVVIRYIDENTIDPSTGQPLVRLELEIPRIVMFENNGAEPKCYSNTMVVADLSKINAASSAERAQALHGYGSNNTGVFDISKPGSSPTILGSYTEICTVQTPANDPDRAWGDVNTDNTVDVADAVLLARFLVSDREAVITDQGIRNGAVTNGISVNPDDITKILRYIAKFLTKAELAPTAPAAATTVEKTEFRCN